MDKIQAKFYQPTEIVSQNTNDNTDDLIPASNRSDLGPVYDMYLPKFPLYLSYFLACCSLFLFIAVPIMLSFMIQ